MRRLSATHFLQHLLHRCFPCLSTSILLLVMGLGFAPRILAEAPIDSAASGSGSSPVEFYFNAPAPAQSPLIDLPAGYLARIQLNSPKDLQQALERAERLFRDGAAVHAAEPLAFVLHGPEVAIFFRENYEQYKTLVDLAARLSALEVIDVRVCQTRMGVLGRSPTVLLPFVDTVPFGPTEIDHLLDDKKYVYF